jgi:succinate dehydrogenase/fumarate reductase flavoprotein subunit
VRTIRTGVLVIGSGGAGMRAAIEAAKHAAVTLVSKGPLGRSGATVLAGADVMADGSSLHKIGFQNDASDSPDAWARDIAIEGFNLNDERLVKVYVEGAGAEVGALVRWGVSVRRTIPRAILTTGMSISAALRKGISECGSSISVVENTMALDLVKRDGCVAGAVALDRATGELVAIEAGATVLATGGWHQAYSFNAGPDEATGDGQAMAYRAGAELVDMEMVTFAPNILLAPPRHRGSLWFYILPGMLLNKNGDAFLSWLDPRVAKLAQTTEWNKLLVSHASANEVSAGRGSPLGGVYFSMKHMPENVFAAIASDHPGWRFQGDDFSGLMETLRAGDAAEVGPAAEYFEGGIRIDDRCRTSVPGLYAAGECTGGLFGGNRVSAATTEMLVHGTVAGRAAGEAAAQSRASPPLRKQDAEALGADALAMLKRSPAVPVEELRAKLRELAYRDVGVVRCGSALAAAGNRLSELAEAVESLGTTTKRREQNLEWCHAVELRNMVQVVRLSALAALEREESRGVHYREDRPVVDNAQWRKHITVALCGNGPALSHAPVDGPSAVRAEVLPYEDAIVQAAEALAA